MIACVRFFYGQCSMWTYFWFIVVVTVCGWYGAGFIVLVWLAILLNKSHIFTIVMDDIMNCALFVV